MNALNDYITEYLEYCKYRKRLNAKTIKAYKIDLKQYNIFSSDLPECLSKNTVDQFITNLHKQYKSKTVKRKIASLKAFFHYMEYRELLGENPFSKLDIRFREAKLLPKTIPLHSIQRFLSTLYAQKEEAKSEYQLRCCLRDIAVIELLFATGMRISELCSLKPSDIDLESNNILIYGKGAKERILQIGNPEVISSLILYQDTFKAEIVACGYFFVNRQQRKNMRWIKRNSLHPNDACANVETSKESIKKHITKSHSIMCFSKGAGASLESPNSGFSPTIQCTIYKNKCRQAKGNSPAYAPMAGGQG